MNDLVEQRHLGYPRHEYEEETFLSDDMVQESSRVDEEEATRAAPLARKTSTSTPLALDLSYRNISRVDKTICGYNLSTLILNNNKIGEVMGLKNLVNLKRLDLSFNLIRRIEGLESLTNLEVLSFYVSGY
jgi:Leucine-rich repeat (LRR) protein